MDKKIWLWLLALFLMAQAVSAFDPGQSYDPTYFDPTAPEHFDYITGDYSTILDWNLVDWSLIPAYRIQEIPVEELRYFLLNPEQRLGMSVDQIAYNLDQIEDLANDVDEAKARQAIEKKTGVTVTSFGQGAKIESGILKATFGENGRLKLENKKGWIVEISDGGEIIVHGLKESEAQVIFEKDISNVDSFTVEHIDTFIGSGFNLENLEGLSFANGHAYVKAGRSASFEGDPFGEYFIPKSKNPVNIYFDGQVHPGNYVSFGKQQVIMGSVPGGEINLEPQPGNDLFLMTKRAYRTSPPKKDNFVEVPDDRDAISLKVTGGNSLTVIDRRSDHKIPLFESRSSSGGLTTIKTGRGIVVQDENGQILVQPPSAIPGDEGDFDQSNSVPFELVTDQPYERLLVSSSNRLRLIDDSGKALVDLSAGLKVTNDLEFNRIKTMTDLEVKHPSVKFYLRDSIWTLEKKYAEGIMFEGKIEITPNMAQVVVEWMEKNPHRAKLVKEIQFDNEENAANFDVGGMMLGERAMDSQTKIENPVRESSSPLETIDHESNHMIDSYIREEEKRSGKSGKTLEEIYAELVQEEKEKISNSPEFVHFCELVTEPEKVRPEKLDALDKFKRGEISLEEAASRLGVDKETLRSYLKKAYRDAFVIDGGEYALREYVSEDGTSRYPEVGTVPLELTPEQASRAIQNGNEFIRKSTQIAYDAGKLGQEEYLQRMGSYCNHDPCGKCLIYTLTCKPE